MIPFALADAFTDQPFAGNTAGVVPRADGLDDVQMQAIARELRQTETCFVSEPAGADTDFALRWFTPTVEVDLCGHATVAAFVCLASDDRIPWRGDLAHVRCATRSGLIDVWLDRMSPGTPRVTMSVGVPALTSATDDPDAVAAAIGLNVAALDPALPLASEPGSARLIVPVARLDALMGMEPNEAGMVAYGQQHGYRRYTLVCRQTAEPRHFVRLRHFAPANGIPEDPVTGTAHAVAAVYLDCEGLLPRGERVVVTGEQAAAGRSGGVVTVEVYRQAEQISDVRIGGTAVISARGNLLA